MKLFKARPRDTQETTGMPIYVEQIVPVSLEATFKGQPAPLIEIITLETDKPSATAIIEENKVSGIIKCTAVDTGVKVKAKVLVECDGEARAISGESELFDILDDVLTDPSTGAPIVDPATGEPIHMSKPLTLKVSLSA